MDEPQPERMRAVDRPGGDTIDILSGRRVDHSRQRNQIVVRKIHQTLGLIDTQQAHARTIPTGDHQRRQLPAEGPTEIDLCFIALGKFPDAIDQCGVDQEKICSRPHEQIA
jgi:hypothetical protein